MYVVAAFITLLLKKQKHRFPFFKSIKKIQFLFIQQLTEPLKTHRFAGFPPWFLHFYSLRGVIIYCLFEMNLISQLHLFPVYWATINVYYYTLCCEALKKVKACKKWTCLCNFLQILCNMFLKRTSIILTGITCYFNLC